MQSWNEMSNWERVEFCNSLAEIMGLPENTIGNILSKTLTRREIDTLSAKSDESVEIPEIIPLKIIIEQMCDQKITAVRKIPFIKFRDDLPDNTDIILYLARRSGLINPPLTPDETFRMEFENKIAVIFVTGDNPNMIESALQNLGYTNACTLNDTSCIVKFLD
jgi:hypothetical protein